MGDAQRLNLVIQKTCVGGKSSMQIIALCPGDFFPSVVVLYFVYKSCNTLRSIFHTTTRSNQHDNPKSFTAPHSQYITSSKRTALRSHITRFAPMLSTSSIQQRHAFSSHSKTPTMSSKEAATTPSDAEFCCLGTWWFTRSREWDVARRQPPTSHAALKAGWERATGKRMGSHVFKTS